MAVVEETPGETGLRLQLTSFKLVHGIAGRALEVMVVGFACNLVVGGVSGDFDRGEPLLFDEHADVAVDGGKAQGFELLLCEGQELFGGERPIGFEESCADCVFLTCIARVWSGGHWRLRS